MNALVVDASFIGLINLPDELATGKSDELARTLSTELLYVPSHWHLEIANMLTKAERNGRITHAKRNWLLEDISKLPVNVDPETSKRAWSVILPLADDQGLTVYDAAYLELAARMSATLASNDKRLITAARKQGVTVLTAPE